MNVTLNIPVETGPDRAGTMARRASDADGEGSNFGKLFEQVGQAEAADQGSQSEPLSGAESNSDDPDVAPRRARKHHDDDRNGQDATPEVIQEEAGVADAPSSPPAAVLLAVAAPAGEVRATGPDASAGRANHRESGQTARANEHVVAVRRFLSGESGQSVKRTAGSGSSAQNAHESLLGETGQGDPAAASSEPAVVAAQPGSAQVRYWARRDSIASFAAPVDGIRQPQTDSSPKTPRAERRTPPTQAASEPINIQVASYERYMAPAGGLKAAIPTDGSVTSDNTPAAAQEVEEALQVQAGSPETTRAPRSGQGWQPLSPVDRAPTPETAAKEPSDRRIATHEDRTAAPELVEQSRQDQADGQESGARGQAFPVIPGHAEEKRSAAIGVSTSGGTAPTGASKPETSPAGPLTAGVASSIVSALGSARAAATQAAPARLDTTNDVTAASPVRSISLNLDMRESGQVDLRISLKGNAVSIKVKAERPETADALQRDEASLRDLLHRAGYEAQQVQIDRRDAAAPRPGDAPASSQQAGGAGTNAFSEHAAGEGNASSSEQRPQGRPDADAFVLQDTDNQDAPRQDRYRSPDRLYV